MCWYQALLNYYIGFIHRTLNRVFVESLLRWMLSIYKEQGGWRSNPVGRYDITSGLEYMHGKYWSLYAYEHEVKIV